jgi:hypothetical protein
MRTLRLSNSATGGPSILLLLAPLRGGQPKAQKLVKEMRQNHERYRGQKKGKFPQRGGLREGEGGGRRALTREKRDRRDRDASWERGGAGVGASGSGRRTTATGEEERGQGTRRSDTGPSVVVVQSAACLVALVRLAAAQLGPTERGSVAARPTLDCTPCS